MDYAKLIVSNQMNHLRNIGRFQYVETEPGKYRRI